VNFLLPIANAIDRGLRHIALASGWLLVVLAGITCFDVVCRKLAIPIPFTKFQELEWHLHTAIFSFWLGFNYTINAHPRVDSYVADKSLGTRAWIELAGCLVFALPYVLVVIWYGWPFLADSWRFNEHSEAANGLPYRWIVKGVLVAGLILLVLAILSVVLRLLAHLSGRVSAERAGLKLGASVSDV
jgi:TRAP-type mannitol/chloroaromatic compound transport system permease small subunit